MDETLKRIGDLLAQRRAELQDHFKSSEVWENTTEELLDRVERLKTRIESSVSRLDKEKEWRVAIGGLRLAIERHAPFGYGFLSGSRLRSPGSES